MPSHGELAANSWRKLGVVGGGCAPLGRGGMAYATRARVLVAIADKKLSQPLSPGAVDNRTRDKGACPIIHCAGGFKSWGGGWGVRPAGALAGGLRDAGTGISGDSRQKTVPTYLPRRCAQSVHGASRDEGAGRTVDALGATPGGRKSDHTGRRKKSRRAGAPTGRNRKPMEQAELKNVRRKKAMIEGQGGATGGRCPRAPHTR